MLVAIEVLETVTQELNQSSETLGITPTLCCRDSPNRSVQDTPGR